MRRVPLVLCLLAASCGTGSLEIAVDAGAEPTSSTVAVSTSALPQVTATSTSTTTTVAPATTTTTTPTTTTSTTTTTTTTTIPLEYLEQDYTPFADAGGVILLHPANRVEHIGFHQAGHDGSRQMEVFDGAARWTTLEDRGRNTGSRTAADVVVDPTAEIRSPVSGTVVRAGTYVLYCDHSDHFVVIDPDQAPGWEVKMFHFEGLQVGVDDRVEAGVTLIGTNARVLPFDSQVDEFTSEPSNPHVHVEVIDPSIPDIPSGSGGC